MHAKKKWQTGMCAQQPFIAAREQGYAREITGFWKCTDRPIKREINRLEF
jgi:hypothetical protein